jgi:non-ribosomal peptide synthetase component E (peptide arylation enzyme)
LIIVPVGAARPKKADLDVLLLKHVAKWQLPDAVEFIEALPLTATGKVSKLTLRKQFSGYQLADLT